VGAAVSNSGREVAVMIERLASPSCELQSPAGARAVHVRFDHGLGDCVYFAHQIPLYVRRGWDVVVSCRPDKELLFHAAGALISASPDDVPSVPWLEGETPDADLRFDNYWRWSKMARNLSFDPMPDIGHPARLWSEYCDVALDATELIRGPEKDRVAAYADKLAGPLILLHTHGASGGERKNMSAAEVRELCRELLARTEGTVLILDWDGNVTPLPHWRVRHVHHDFGPLSTMQLLYLLGRADLMIGIDSGPLHLARFTRTPAIGVWMSNGSPATWSLPRAMQTNIVVGREARCWSRHARVPFHILECDEAAAMPALAGRTAERMLAPARYLPNPRRGLDTLLQQFVRDWQGGRVSSFGGFNDRDEGFDRLLRMAAARFERPGIVETGCIRSEEDFAGAGFSTLLLGIFAAGRGGELVSIDHDAVNCEFARRTVGCLGSSVLVVEDDSVSFLADHRQVIDVLYLDSRDSDWPGSAEHAVRELEAAYPVLHEQSIVAIDDTCYQNGNFIGSGSLAVPWLLERGWILLHSGHQTMLSRTGH
jgi:hypothetical protein